MKTIEKAVEEVKTPAPAEDKAAKKAEALAAAKLKKEQAEAEKAQKKAEAKKAADDAKAAKKLEADAKKAEKKVVPPKKADDLRTIHILKNQAEFRGKRAEAFASLKEGMTVQEFHDICKPIFNDSAAGGVLIGIYLLKELVRLDPPAAVEAPAPVAA